MPWSDWLIPSSNQNHLKPWKSFDDLPAKNLSQVYSSYDIVRKTTLGLFRSFGYREADFEAIYENGSNTIITIGIFTRLLFHFEPECKLWPEQLLKITEDNNEILLKFIQHNCPSIHRGKFKRRTVCNYVWDRMRHSTYAIFLSSQAKSYVTYSF